MESVLTFPRKVESSCTAAVVNALTIDVEDYYQVSGFEPWIDRSSWDRFEPRVELGTEIILARLAEADVRATFFVLGWVARQRPDLVRAIRDAGHEIASHGYAHRLVYNQTPEEFRADIRLARTILEDVTGQPVRAYRAPSFSVTGRSLWALDVLIDEGFVYDSSIYPVYHDRYGIPGTPLEPHRIDRPSGTIWEFPPPVWRLFGCPVPVGGGGYFRLYPYPVTRHGLRAINSAGRPFAVYLHPWEFDPGQPRLSVGRMRAWRHYVNLHRTETRLARLLRDFAFAPLSEALENYVGERPSRLAA